MRPRPGGVRDLQPRPAQKQIPISYNIRFAFLVPVVVFMKLFGVNEAAWVAFVTLCSLVSASGFLLLVGAYFAWQWVRFGDPLYNIHLVREFAIFLPHSREILLDYPRMLFLSSEYGTRLAGYYPHAVLLLAARAAAGPELLCELVARQDLPVAAEVGKRISSEAPGPTEVAHLTGLACARAAKAACARRHLDATLAQGPDGEQVRETIVAAAVAAAQEHDFGRAHELAAQVRRRFPDTPLPPELAEIESDVPEGIARHHEGRLPAARRIFSSILARESRPDRRRRSRYFVTLTLFRMGEVEEGVEALDWYRMVYGRGPDWVELRYRHGEALRVLAPSAARDIFTDVTTGCPASPWAGEARRQLETLARGGIS